MIAHKRSEELSKPTAVEKSAVGSPSPKTNQINVSLTEASFSSLKSLNASRSSLREIDFSPTKGLFRERSLLNPAVGWWGEIRAFIPFIKKNYREPRKIFDLVRENHPLVNLAPFRIEPKDPGLANLRDQRLKEVKSSMTREHICNGSWLHRSVLSVPGLPRELEGFTILHLSDVHFHRHRLERILEIRALAAYLEKTREKIDLTACTGDLITDNAEDLNDLALKVLRRLAPDSVRVFTRGNHDFYESSLEYVKQAMSSLGYQDLSGKSLRMLVDGAPLNIFGVDDFLEGAPAVPGILATNKHETNLLLTHNLDALRSNCPDYFDLTLSGHLHAGEVNFGIFNGIDVMRLFGYSQNVNQQVFGWDALSPRNMSFISPGHVRHWFHFNVEKRGAAVIRLKRGTEVIPK